MIYASKGRGYADGTPFEVLMEISTLIATAKEKVMEDNTLSSEEANCLIRGAVQAGLMKSEIKTEGEAVNSNE